MKNIRKGNIVYVNQQCLETFGITKKEEMVQICENMNCNKKKIKKNIEGFENMQESVSITEFK